MYQHSNPHVNDYIIPLINNEAEIEKLYIFEKALGQVANFMYTMLSRINVHS